MDNLSHSLAGLALAECVVAYREARAGPVSPAWRVAATWLAVIASSVPDLDLAVTSLTAGPVGYLLHHRGHTHTLAFVPPAVAVLLLGTWVMARWRRFPWNRGDWRWLAGLAGAALLLHLAFDYLNSYGVHVLWPVDNRWAYGDVLFILEPSLWIALALPLIPGARRRASAGLLAAIVAVGMGLIAFSGFVPAPVGAGLGVLSVLLYWIGRRAIPARRGSVALAAAAVLIGVFTLSSQRVGATLRDEYAERVGAGRLHDLALTPMPANPLCWRVISVSVEGADIVLRDGIFAWHDDGTCPEETHVGVTPLAPVTTWVPSRVRWRGETRQPLAALRTLAAQCEVAAFLRFARAPFLLDGGAVIADLRFDRQGRESFAAMSLSPGGPCPARVPPWEPPLAPLLGDTGTES